MFAYRPTGARIGTQSYNEVYPNLGLSGVDTSQPTTLQAASGSRSDKVPGTSPVVVLVVIVAVLVAVRVLYDMAPVSGRGL